MPLVAKRALGLVLDYALLVCLAIVQMEAVIASLVAPHNARLVLRMFAVLAKLDFI